MEKIFHGLKLISLCGGGAYGEVWYCEDISGRLMAVKIISKRKIGPHWERELRGVRNYCRITENNPALLQIFHVEEDEEFFFYTMEPADSLTFETYSPDTLAARLQRGPVAPDELYRILSVVFDGMKAIHDAGFSHRDIKPDNILFVKGVPKLADIGLLSSLSASMTQLAGTLEIIPPEERTAENVEYSAPAARQRNDLYALGKVIYCTVTGNSPSDYPAVPPTMTVSLPVKLFLRLAFQLCRKEPEGRLDNLEDIAAEFAAIRRKLANGETLNDRLCDILNSGWFEIKSILKSSGKILRKFWYLFLLVLLLGGGSAYWIWKPAPPFDITKQKTQKYVNEILGISMDIPFHWEIVSKENFQKWMNEAYGDRKDKRFSKKQLDAMLEGAKQGQNMIYCDFNQTFADNIVVNLVPFPPRELEMVSIDEFRVMIKDLFEGELNFKTEIFAAEKKTIAGYTCIVVDYSYLPNIRANGYWFVLKDKVILICLTTKKETFVQRQAEFNSILKTLKIEK